MAVIMPTGGRQGVWARTCDGVGEQPIQALLRLAAQRPAFKQSWASPCWTYHERRFLQWQGSSQACRATKQSGPRWPAPDCDGGLTSIC